LRDAPKRKRKRKRKRSLPGNLSRLAGIVHTDDGCVRDGWVREEKVLELLDESEEVKVVLKH
jgi:hypothetical protein